MSGSIAAIAAYDGTGTQGYGTTDKSLPGVKSVFWNENDTDKYYVNGCSFSEVSSNKGEITTPETVIFTFDNDVDAINDLVLTIGATNIYGGDNLLTPWFMAGFIERIEICIGNQVISTIFTTQIKHLLVSDKYLNLSTRRDGNVYRVHGTSENPNGGVYTNIRLPIFNLINSKTNCSYLMACANNQALQVKVYPQFFDEQDYHDNLINSGERVWTKGIDNKFTFNLYANKYSMTNAERDFLRSQVIPKRTNVTQSATISNPQLVPGYPNILTSNSITINCDHFNINAEKLYITSLFTEFVPLFNVELFLNSTSYCGTIQSSVSEISRGSNYIDAVMIQNVLAHAAVATPFNSLGSIAEIYFAKNSKEYQTDQNYVPLSKYDSIRIVLTPLADKTLTKNFLDYLTVIVEGKCTALYQNGAVVFNNY